MFGRDVLNNFEVMQCGHHAGGNMGILSQVTPAKTQKTSNLSHGCSRNILTCLTLEYVHLFAHLNTCSAIQVKIMPMFVIVHVTP